MEPERKVNFTLADLVDRASISQIKETLFSGEKQELFTRDLANVSADLKLVLDATPLALSGTVVRLIMLIAQCNLHVWRNKDRMSTESLDYDRLLARAQDLNGLRNFARNRLMELTGDLTPGSKHSTFLDEIGEHWYSAVLSGLSSSKAPQDGAEGND